MTETIGRVLCQAARAGEAYAGLPAARRAELLRRIAAALLDVGDQLVDHAAAETALSRDRIVAERGRTVAQLRMFADLVDEGSWVDARIDTAQPARQNVPKPDLRRMLVPIGPVVVFGASNFPLAFCVAGGDTAAALAAGCPAIVKPHRAHPRTAALAAEAVCRAVDALSLPTGLFAVVDTDDHASGLALVRHPLTRAVAFTGSLRGGRALWDAAASRPDPIPVFAEMGSLNPMFLLPSALERQAERMAEGFVASMTLGVGQFCTKPGVVVAIEGAGLVRFVTRLVELLATTAGGTMLSYALCDNYRAAVARLRDLPSVETVACSTAPVDVGARWGDPIVLRTSARAFLTDQRLRDEMFGPAALLVVAGDEAELDAVARELPGQLTATIHASPEDLAARPSLVRCLVERAGRLVFNHFPTGLEVCPSTHHGGPYPATTDVRSTSVGTAAILRFARPVCFQGFPQTALPPELRDENPRGIWRTVDGVLTRSPIESRQ